MASTERHDSQGWPRTSKVLLWPGLTRSLPAVAGKAAQTMQ